MFCGKVFEPTSSVNLICSKCSRDSKARNDRYRKENTELVNSLHLKWRLMRVGKRVPKELLKKINELQELNRKRRIAKRDEAIYNNIHGIKNGNRKPLPAKLQQIACNRRAIRKFESQRDKVELLPYAENGVELL